MNHRMVSSDAADASFTLNQPTSSKKDGTSVASAHVVRELVKACQTQISWFEELFGSSSIAVRRFIRHFERRDWIRFATSSQY